MPYFQSDWEFNGICDAQSFIEGIIAIHLASYVASPTQDCGGLMLVAAPEQLKTTFLDILEDNFDSARSISNTYMDTMIRMQPAFYNRAIRSLIFPDLQAIYAGDPRTANRIEMMMMQLAAEATRTIGGDQDSSYAKFESRCTIFAGMQEPFRKAHERKWADSGFHRRFLWGYYALKDPEVLLRAICNWTRAEIGSFRFPPIPFNLEIKDCLTKKQRDEIATWVRHQPEPYTSTIRVQLLCKATSALYWHYKQANITKDAMDTMRNFAECLQKRAALIVLPEQDYDRPDYNGVQKTISPAPATKSKVSVRKTNGGVSPLHITKHMVNEIRAASK